MVFQLDGCQETVNTFILKVSEGHKESVKAHNTVILLLLVGYTNLPIIIQIQEIILNHFKVYRIET